MAADQVIPKRKINSASTVRPSATTRRFDTAGDASRELFESFNKWSGAVGSYGVQTAYAVIAANWAVFGTTKVIVDNCWAKYSLGVAVGFLAIHLICTDWISRLCDQRIKYANRDQKRWQKEFEDKNTPASSWPYTKKIERIRNFLRFLKVWVPVVSGGLFIGGVISL